jgi:hypothetical protein
MAFDTKDYNWFGSSGSPSGGTSGFPDYSGAFGPNSPIGADTWQTGFGVNENKGKNFLDAFTKGLGDLNKNKYQDQAGQGGIQTGGGKESSSGNIGKLASDLSIYTPSAPYQPFTVQGTPGKSGIGGALGTLVGIGASFIPGIGPGIAAALPAIGGSIGGSF